MRYLVILLLALNLAAQAQTFEIKPITQTTEDGGQLIFPLIESKNLPEVARRINYYLQLKVLSALVEKHPTKPLGALYCVEHSYTVLTNNSRFLCIKLSEVNFSMRYITSHSYFTFDSRTGDLVAFDDLLTPTGKTQLLKGFVPEFKKRLESRVDDPITGDEYKTCLSDAATLEQLEVLDFSIADDKIQCYGGQCLEAGTNEGDVRGPYERSLNTLIPMLSPYGNYLVGNKTEPRRSGNLLGSVWRGKIDGKYPITLILHAGYSNEGAEVIRGVEVYDQYGDGIELKGTRAGNKIVISEMQDWQTAVATFEGIWNGNQITGTFKNVKTGKVLPFALSR